MRVGFVPRSGRTLQDIVLVVLRGIIPVPDTVGVLVVAGVRLIMTLVRVILLQERVALAVLVVQQEAMALISGEEE